MKRTPMTRRGAEALRAELKRLKSEARPAIIKAIADARGHGDLSENAEYHAAREQQGFIERRITEVERKLANADVIDTATLPDTGKVVFGATVELEDQADGARVVYQIAGEDEARVSRVIDRDRIHAAKKIGESGPAPLIEMKRHFAIGAGSKAGGAHLSPQFRIIVDFAVGDENGALVCI